MFLKKLDPKGELSVLALWHLLLQHMLAYRALVLLDNIEPGMMVKKALAIYRKWHVLNWQLTWGAVLFSCRVLQSLFRTLYLQGYNSSPCLPV